MPLDIDVCSALMSEALKEAENALAKDEVPVGAVVADRNGYIIARGYNRSVSSHDPTAHAEIIALRNAAIVAENYRLSDLSLCVTMEPCLMCAGALLNARIKTLVYGADDPKAGAVESLFKVLNDKRLNHNIEVISGVHKNRCKKIIQDFFKERRKNRI